MSPADRQLKRVDLGDAGVAWVRHALETGGGLASAVLQNARLASGAVYGYFPEVASAIDLTAFDEAVFSAVASKEANAVGAAAADAAIELARATGGNLFVAEQYLRREDFRPGMRWGEGLRLDAERAMFHEDRVLLWRNLGETTTDEIGWLVGDEVAVITNDVRPQAFPALHELNASDLASIAIGVRAVLVAAYAGVSLVVWLSEPI